MAFAILTLTLGILLLVVGGMNRLSIGMLLFTISIALRLPMADPLVDKLSVLPLVPDVATLFISAAGLSMACTSWRIPGGPKVVTILIPTIAFMLVCAGTIAMPFLVGEPGSPGTFAQDALHVSFTIICMFGSARIAYIASHLAKAAARVSERLTLDLVKVGMAVGSASSLAVLVSLFARLSGGAVMLQQLVVPALSVGAVGAFTGCLAMTLAVAQKAICKVKQHYAVRKSMPDLESVWHKVMNEHGHLIHPSSGTYSADRGYRMLMEIRDALAWDKCLAESLDEQDYVVIEQAEDLLVGVEAS